MNQFGVVRIGQWRFLTAQGRIHMAAKVPGAALMSIVHHHPMTAEEYDAAAWEYYRSLPMEHFMEATPQATQRLVAYSAFELLRLLRPEIHFFSELLVQYLYGGRLRQVVPDNMLVVGDLPDHPRSNFAIELEPVAPFMMMEWVSESSEGKDYGESFRKYEQELKTRYYLCFYPERSKWEVYRHDDQRYVQLEPDLNSRVEIPELDLHIGLLDGWIRFWYQGRLLEIPSELQQRLDQLSERLERQSEQLERQSARVDDMLAMLRRQLERRARQAGRQDVLDGLWNADAIQMERWLDEL
jgi:Uma2 family endonuclease